MTENVTTYKAHTPNGGSCTIRQVLPYGTAGGASNLTPAQFAAYKHARLLADVRNGGDMAKVRSILEAAGFTVLVA